VSVTVNSHNGGGSDGENGGFVGALGVPGGNFMHVATADGRVLFAGHLSGINTDVFGALNGALKKFRALPKSERAPGAFKVPTPKYSPRDALPKPPPGGLVLRVYERNLKRDAKGEIALITKQDVKDRKQFPAENWQWADAILTQPMPDIMWLKQEEWQALVPENPKRGDEIAVPQALRVRLFCYHLINGTFGLPDVWWPGQLVSGNLTLTVEDVSPVLRLRLRGAALLATDHDPAKARCGYDAKVTGVLEYDPGKKAFTRFDIVAMGDWWGGEPHPDREPQFVRPGRTPFGVAFELARGDRAGDFMPPKGQPARNVAQWYFSAEK
jgi:hypothetical protein